MSLKPCFDDDCKRPHIMAHDEEAMTKPDALERLRQELNTELFTVDKNPIATWGHRVATRCAEVLEEASEGAHYARDTIVLETQAARFRSVVEGKDGR